jgi:hypothetical protein
MTKTPHMRVPAALLDAIGLHISEARAAAREAVAELRRQHAADVAALRAELAELRRELGTARALADLQQRLDRVEASRSAALRSVS